MSFVSDKNLLANRTVLILLISIALIFSMGIVMVFNTTAAEVIDRTLQQSTHQACLKQIFFASIALLGALLVWFIGYENMLKLSGPLLCLGTLLLLLVFIPGIGQQVNGANRWIRIFGYSLQPSEFAKILIPLYYIHFVTTAKKIDFFTFFKLIALLGVPIGLILLEPDNGTVAILLVTLLVLFILTEIKWSYWLIPFIAFVFCGTLIASQMKHVPERIHIYLNPELDLKGKGHQPHQAKIAAGSGGFFGRGIGESMQKLDYLPESRNDYIAAIYAEECGFIGILGLIILYMILGGIGFYLATLVKEVRGYYLMSITTFIICFQAFLNLGVVSGLLPSKGTNLPFFSQGGTSLLVNFIALSLMLNVVKKSNVKT
ncbi:MAG TPA: putative peptidoglycan glycosyltransferase FtsW [Rhabdochlamydiaceae bacterium]|nr:putative peptidoglycan glycosyltransferase FtsW [Rhabdochlamydiaceae bacterium]